MKPVTRPDPFSPAVEQVLRRMPAKLRNSFTDAQLRALSSAIDTPRRDGVRKFEVSLPFWGERYFLVLMCGPERRSPDRLIAEGQARLGRVVGTYAALVACIAGLMVVSAALFAFSVAKILAP